MKIVHCFRSPVGGIFRHVRDLVDAQYAAGHSVGILCDSSTGGEYEDRLFEQIRPKLKLGLMRIRMDRAVAAGDLVALLRCASAIARWNPDILHAHGAKGGAYARIIGTGLRLLGSRPARLYCPHGGSIHYNADKFSGRLYFLFERVLERMTDRLIFVSQYELDGYRAKVGAPKCPYDIVHNGLQPEEFEAVATSPSAADFLYIGMMRDLKGPDVFLDALALLQKRHDRPVTAHFVGDGADKSKYLEQIGRLGLEGTVTVHDAMPARKAFAMAKVVVVPSRAESMPYLVLEAAAAGKRLVATRVGGIPEIFQDQAGALVEYGNAKALAEAMRRALGDDDKAAKRLQRSVRARFSVARMVGDIEAIYRKAR